MSFIITNSNDNIIQIFPPKEKICVEDFLGEKFNIRIVQNADGTIKLYTLNVPFCISFTNYSEIDNILTQEVISINSHYEFKKTNYERPFQHDMSNPFMHKHDYFEMIYVMEGEFKHYIEDKCITFVKGQACLLNKNVYHCEQFFKDCKLVYFCFSKEYCIESFQSNLIKKKSAILYGFVNNDLNNT